jgi:TRAP-type C4-dicarboxylate transport system permease small subunit
MRTVLTIAALVLILLAALAFAWFGWTGTDADVPTAGYGALAAGIFGAVVIGCGLMALIFYSHRHGYDAQPEREVGNTPRPGRAPD